MDGLCSCIQIFHWHVPNMEGYECHTAALKHVTGLSDEDLIFVSFHNRVYEIPFYVAIDHQTCSVVVSIRGTLSLSDTLTDLTADCDKLFTEGCPQGLFCHRGMLSCIFVKNKLEESHALSDAFALHQSYSLAITGHSLGGGTAALLAVLLRLSIRTFVVILLVHLED
ncbi:diacylglycerol lipase-beta [Caerostris extrusa]|uniref:sn-1-specific diacylglycerol lipase n=1 Tax=Caerostris extrusa TaxID=172846 RepID=A0AAV4MD24_CAEEX|nr:diacylglycerol lipase-beta [Caerostris extrusa]